MVNILLISHGEFAKGLLDSANMLIGEIPNIGYITFEKEMGIDELRTIVEAYLDSINGSLMVFTDLKGGTPFNVISLLTNDEKNTFVFYGMNLPMVVEACLLRDNLDVNTLAKKINDNIVEGIGLS